MFYNPFWYLCQTFIFIKSNYYNKIPLEVIVTLLSIDIALIVAIAEEPNAFVNQFCIIPIFILLFYFIVIIKQISNFICITWYYEYHNNKILLSLFLKILNRNFKRNDKYIAYLDNKFFMWLC